MYKYSILMYNFNNYEILRDPIEIDPECEYIYVTDNPNLKSDKWKIIIDKDLEGLSVFDKCYNVRFNLFKYATTSVCIYLDGSIQIYKSLRKIYDDFIKSNCDIGLNIHPTRNNLIDEYREWIRIRNYDQIQAQKCMLMFKIAEYDLQFKGLYQGTMRICKNTELNKNIDTFTLNTLKILGKENEIERLDQTIYSFIINKFFNEIKIFGFSQQVFQSEYMRWCQHGSSYIHPYNKDNNKDGYILNKLSKLYHLV